MLQQVMTKPGEIIFREVPIPEVKDEQILVKIMNIGICGSDIHVYHGKHPFTKYPVTQGHEVSGEIVELGANVTGFHKGQKITIESQVYCGHCYPCRHGKYNLCEELKVMGFQTTGTASEYFAVDASKVTSLPEEMSYEEGAMIEPLAVAVHGVKQMFSIILLMWKEMQLIIQHIPCASLFRRLLEQHVSSLYSANLITREELHPFLHCLPVFPC